MLNFEENDLYQYLRLEGIQFRNYVADLREGFVRGLDNQSASVRIQTNRGLARQGGIAVIPSRSSGRRSSTARRRHPAPAAEPAAKPAASGTATTAASTTTRAD